MTEIRGKTAVVTGGGSGIGMALAKALAKEGAAVVVADILLDNAKKVADEIVAAGGKAVAAHCDVSDRASVRELKQRTDAEFGRIQLLFANAGVTSFDSLVEMSDDDVDWVIQVNLMGAMNTIRAFLPDMIAAREGHIVATASMAGLLPGWIPVHAPYSAAKAGVIGLVMNLALELRPHDVYTTIYCPGGVVTGMKENNSRYRPQRFGGPREGGVHVPAESFKGQQLALYPPEVVAPIVLRAVRNRRPFVFDHAEQRQLFRSTYSSVIESCYDDIDAWEREHGKPGAQTSQTLGG